jgi:capsular polysaccharide biosynthesis protein/Mrp family chromosome partitioning ATPase
VSSEAIVLDPSSDRPRPGVLASVRAHSVLITLLAVVLGAGGYFASMLLPTSYTAQSSVFFSVTSPFDPMDEMAANATRFTADQVELIVTSDVLSRAGARVVPPVPVAEVRASTSAVGSAETNRVTVSVERPTAEEARALADAVTRSYAEVARQRVVEVTSRAQDAIADGFIEAEMLARSAAYFDGVQAIEPAVLPIAPSSPLLAQNTLLAAVVGLLIGIGLAVLRDQRRARRPTVADFDMLLGAPLITRYPRPASSAVADVVRTDVPAAQDLLATIDVTLDGRSQVSVLFVSWQDALTTTSLVASTGFAAAKAGRQIVLIDGGLKERGISSLTDVDPGVGLEALADPDNPISQSVRDWRIGHAEVGVVPLSGWEPKARVGVPVRPQVLRSAAERLHSIASLVLVDAPPLADLSVGLALGRGVDGVVLVVDSATSIDEAHEMGRKIALSGITLLGYVLAVPAQRRALAKVWPRRSPVPVEAGEWASRT